MFEIEKVENVENVEKQYDVILVGAGPSGLTTATALARAGASVVVLEKHGGLCVLPKATGLRPRTREIFRSWARATSTGRTSSWPSGSVLLRGCPDSMSRSSARSRGTSGHRWR